MVVFDRAASMQLYNVTPLNRFPLRLDFTEPPGFNTYNPSDDPTPNTSNQRVIGDDSTWVTGVYESTLRFFRKRKRCRAWLHTQEAFNARLPKGLTPEDNAASSEDLLAEFEALASVQGQAEARRILRYELFALKRADGAVPVERVRTLIRQAEEDGLLELD